MRHELREQVTTWKALHDLEYGCEIPRKGQSLLDIIGDEKFPEMRSTYLLLETQGEYVVKPINCVNTMSLTAMIQWKM